MASSVEVIEYTRDDIVWPFGETPYLRVGRTKWGAKVSIDPTPAYAHDWELATRILNLVAERFPIGWPVTVNLLPVECLSRTNGTTCHETDYDYDGPRDEDGNIRSEHRPTIYLSAKRIPIHPAMTRYLVAHEYGHVVEQWLNVDNGGKYGDSTLERQYAEMRGVSKPDAYGAGLWHRTPGEVFANDFRILVCGIEPEFWPHPGIDRPEGQPAVTAWWSDRLAELVSGVRLAA